MQPLRSAFQTAVGALIAGMFFGLSVPAVADEATAKLKGVDGGDVGTATLIEAPAGLLVKLELKGVSPGPHAVHVHESGKCDGDLAGAGAIFNPLGAKHGLLSEDGPMAGDLPNVHVGADGAATAEFLSPFLSLSKEADDGLFDADGASVVIFEKADDYLSEPEGGAGKRIACGAIATK